MRNQLESVTRPEMTNKFTMREMIEQTLLVYQGLYDQSLAEEQALADAAAIKKIKKSLKPTIKPFDKPSDRLVNQEPALPITLKKDKIIAQDNAAMKSDKEVVQHKDSITLKDKKLDNASLDKHALKNDALDNKPL